MCSSDLDCFLFHECLPRLTDTSLNAVYLNSDPQSGRFEEGSKVTVWVRFFFLRNRSLREFRRSSSLYQPVAALGVENEDAARFQRQPDHLAGSDRFVAVDKGADVEIADTNVRERVLPGHGKRCDAAFDKIVRIVRPSVDGRRRIEALRANGQVNLPPVGDFFRAGNGDSLDRKSVV